MFVGLIVLQADKAPTQSATANRVSLTSFGFDGWCTTAPGIQAGDSILLTIYYAPGSHTSRFTAQAPFKIISRPQWLAHKPRLRGCVPPSYIVQ